MKQDEQLEKPNLSEQNTMVELKHARKYSFSPKPNGNFQFQQKCKIIKIFKQIWWKTKFILLIASHYILQILSKTLQFYCYVSD